jgi:hypothetical protein
MQAGDKEGGASVKQEENKNKKEQVKKEEKGLDSGRWAFQRS